MSKWTDIVNPDNYAEFTVSLDASVKQLRDALREKRWPEADRCAADAMKALARLHGFIARQQ